MTVGVWSAFIALQAPTGFGVQRIRRRPRASKPPYITNFKCVVKFNITNLTGDIVLNHIRKANVPAMIEEQLEGQGSVTEEQEMWNSGIRSHDLYLTYRINVNCYRLIKRKKNKIVAKLLRYTLLQKSIIKNILKESIEKGFLKNLQGRGIIAVLKSCNVT